MGSRPQKFRWLLLLSNAAAFALFVSLRDPPPAEYLAALDSAQRTGGLLLNSGIDAMLACRNLYSWSPWHGGETFAVKAYIVANAPALAFSALVDTVGRIGATGIFSACRWSWIVAGFFLVAASVQWWSIGALIEYLVRRHSLHRARQQRS